PDCLAELIAPIQRLAVRCRELVTQDPDKALVALLLMHEYPYIVIHPIHVAIISMLLEIHFRSSEAHQLSVVCAALTQNLSMNSLQEELFTQLFPLDNEQRQLLERHPLETAEQLQQAGVTDALWLDIIRQHHEKWDGLGYPLGLAENAILTEATVICLADRYSAMVFDRPFRETREPRNILKSYLDESKASKSNLPLIFIKQLGVYPPGLFVRLNNGETAMVVKRTGPSDKPLVVSYINPRGVSFDPPVLRDTGVDAGRHYGIKAVCKVDPEFFDLDNVWSAVVSLKAPR
ncbi:MAG: HD domain-containing protein, partial [Gammaproteobacteria bacterium]|nr:HD domain-containing protein [Gammaproteobacteria bacterium]